MKSDKERLMKSIRKGTKWRAIENTNDIKGSLKVGTVELIGTDIKMDLVKRRKLFEKFNPYKQVHIQARYYGDISYLNIRELTSKKSKVIVLNKKFRVIERLTIERISFDSVVYDYQEKLREKFIN